MNIANLMIVFGSCKNVFLIQKYLLELCFILLYNVYYMDNQVIK